MLWLLMRHQGLYRGSLLVDHTSIGLGLGGSPMNVRSRSRVTGWTMWRAASMGTLWRCIPFHHWRGLAASRFSSDLGALLVDVSGPPWRLYTCAPPFVWLCACSLFLKKVDCNGAI